MKIISSLLFILTFSTSLSAYSSVCSPCDPCWIAGVGGPILEHGSVTDTVSRGVAEGLKQGHYYSERATAIVNDTISTIQGGSTTILNILNASPGDFVPKGTPPKEIVVKRADPATSTIKNIMKSNMEVYADQPFADHEGDYNFVKKRQYIRQQANLQLLARILVLKHQTKEIFKIIDDMETKIDDSSKKASNQGALESNENKTKLLMTTAFAKITWAKLLMIQKQLRAAQLQYNALLGLATAKRHKTYWNPKEELPEENQQ